MCGPGRWCAALVWVCMIEVGSVCWGMRVQWVHMHSRGLCVFARADMSVRVAGFRWGGAKRGAGGDLWDARGAGHSVVSGVGTHTTEGAGVHCAP